MSKKTNKKNEILIEEVFLLVDRYFTFNLKKIVHKRLNETLLVAFNYKKCHIFNNMLFVFIRPIVSIHPVLLFFFLFFFFLSLLASVSCFHLFLLASAISTILLSAFYLYHVISNFSSVFLIAYWF